MARNFLLTPRIIQREYERTHNGETIQITEANILELFSIDDLLLSLDDFSIKQGWMDSTNT